MTDEEIKQRIIRTLSEIQDNTILYMSLVTATDSRTQDSIERRNSLRESSDLKRRELVALLDRLVTPNIEPPKKRRVCTMKKSEIIERLFLCVDEIEANAKTYAALQCAAESQSELYGSRRRSLRMTSESKRREIVTLLDLLKRKKNVREEDTREVSNDELDASTSSQCVGSYSHPSKG